MTIQTPTLAWWREPEPVPRPLETIERRIVGLLAANALMRLWVADKALLDRKWATHQGLWVLRADEKGRQPSGYRAQRKASMQADITAALQRSGGNQRAAARALGMSPYTLCYHVKTYKLTANKHQKERLIS